MIIFGKSIFGTNPQVEIERQKTLQGIISLKRDTLDQLNKNLKEFTDNVKNPPQSLSSDLYPNTKNIFGKKLSNSGFWYYGYEQLQRTARIAYHEIGTGRAIINRFCDIVIGASLDLQSNPIWDLIEDKTFDDPEKRKSKTKEIETRFKNWSNQKEFDYNGVYNFDEMNWFAFFTEMLVGEYFLLFRYSPTLKKNPLRVQFIPPENVRGGTLPNNSTNKLENGIEYKRGRAVAYHIYDDETGETKRVTKFGPKSGRTFIVHHYLATDIRQKRGVGILIDCIPQLARLSDFENLELKAAVLNALFAIWIESPDDTDGRPIINKKIPTKKIFNDKTKPTTADYETEFDRLDISEGGICLDEMPAGHKPHSFDTKRPNVNFEGFYNLVQRNICISKNIPDSIVNYVFENNYSSTRAKLRMFWYTILKLTKDHGNNFCSPILKMFLWGEFDNGRIDMPGWQDEEQRNAWCNARWNGNQQPDIDPLKSVKAHQEEQKFAYKTGQQITSERGGGDYDENLEQVTNEFLELTEAVRPYVELNKKGGQN